MLFVLFCLPSFQQEYFHISKFINTANKILKKSGVQLTQLNAFEIENLLKDKNNEKAVLSFLKKHIDLPNHLIVKTFEYKNTESFEKFCDLILKKIADLIEENKEKNKSLIKLMFQSYFYLTLFHYLSQDHIKLKTEYLLGAILALYIVGIYFENRNSTFLEYFNYISNLFLDLFIHHSPYDVFFKPIEIALTELSYLPHGSLVLIFIIAFQEYNYFLMPGKKARYVLKRYEKELKEIFLDNSIICENTFSSF